MMNFFSQISKYAAVFGVLLSLALILPELSHAQDARKETLVVANESGPNMLDIHGVGANRPSYGVACGVAQRRRALA